jgi:LacI family transcriptional regulator
MSIVKVAKMAGVSHATVSRVINGGDGVSPKSVLRVNQAMEQLGYTPPVVRRGPQPRNRRKARTGNVAVLLLGSTPSMAMASITAAVVHGAESALAESGYNMILSQIGEKHRLPPNVISGNIDGLLLHGFPPTKELTQKLSSHPCVWLLSRRSRMGYWGDRVGPDNEAIGMIAVDYLKQKGHKQLAFMHVNSCHMGFTHRAEAFEAAALDAGLGVDILTDSNEPIAMELKEELDQERIGNMIDRLLALPNRPTGIFVPRATLMALVYRSLYQRGVTPGRDMQFIACDYHPMLDGLFPVPATIDIQPQIIGRQAVEQLIWRMDHHHDPVRADIQIQPRLIEGVDADMFQLTDTHDSNEH